MSSKLIIGITGKIGSGKTTLANYLVEQHGYKEYSMAGPLKEIGRIFGFSQEQLYGTQEQKLEVHEYWGVSSRQFLQKVGTELFRDQLPRVLPEMKLVGTVWVDLFRLKCQQEPDLYVVSDVRFLDEAKAIKDMDGIIIRCVRENEVSSADGKEHVHKSEMEMLSIKHDFLVDNNLLDKDKAQSYIDKILERYS